MITITVHLNSPKCEFSHIFIHVLKTDSILCNVICLCLAPSLARQRVLLKAGSICVESSLCSETKSVSARIVDTCYSLDLNPVIPVSNEKPTSTH